MAETAGIRFTDRTANDRLAQTVFEEFLTRPALDNPERTMRPQEILTLALVALGQQDEIEKRKAPVPDVITLLTQIKAHVETIEGKIEGLVINGVLTEAQGAEVSRAIGVSKLGNEFEQNMLATLKPGRSRVSEE